MVFLAIITYLFGVAFMIAHHLTSRTPVTNIAVRKHQAWMDWAALGCLLASLALVIAAFMHYSKQGPAHAALGAGTLIGLVLLVVIYIGLRQVRTSDHVSPRRLPQQRPPRYSSR